MTDQTSGDGREPARRLVLDFDGGHGLPAGEREEPAAQAVEPAPGPDQGQAPCAGTREPSVEERVPFAEVPHVTAPGPSPARDEGTLPRRKAAMAAACLLVVGVLAVGVGAAVGQNAAVSQLSQASSQIETPESDRADDTDDATDATDAGVTEAEDAVADANSTDVDGSSPAATDDATTLPTTATGDAGSATTQATDGQAATAKDDAGKEEKAASEDCDHQWEPYGVTTKVVAAKTHEERVPAETEVVTEYHTVCNTCHERIDGQAREHLEKTGHAGYTTNVPSKVTKVKRKATTRTVVDTPAMKVSTWHQKRCERCGEVKDLKATKKKAEQLKGSK